MPQGATTTPGSPPPPAAPRTGPADPAGLLPRPARVAVLVLENRTYEQVIGNRNAPFLNRLAQRGALATRYFALGRR